VSTEERTEKPTWKRLRDARDKGQVLRSREVHDVLQMGAVVLALVWFAHYTLEGLAAILMFSLEAMGHGARRAITAGELTRMGLETGRTLAVLVGPIALASVIGGLAGVMAQGGINLSAEPLTPNLGKLNPVNGLKRLVPTKAGLDLVRTLFALAGMLWVGHGVLQGLLEDVQQLGRAPLPQSGLLAWTAMITFLKRSLIVMAVLAGADYGLQRWRYMKGLRMTKQEIKDESRMQEGNPEIKGRVRKAQREMARKRMLAAVPTATVVITNPTHIAVALEYRREKMFAPTVVAMGADHLAAKIRAIARDRGVPIVENVTLARALYANADVGEVIPGDLFEAVAEVLAYLIRLKQLVL
jgi:flagellar biosynthetic protein FlhB